MIVYLVLAPLINLIGRQFASGQIQVTFVSKEKLFFYQLIFLWETLLCNKYFNTEPLMIKKINS